MINYSRLTPTSEKKRSWHPNNNSTSGSAFNSCTAQGRYLRSTSLAKMPRPLELRPPSSLFLQRNKPRSSASSTGTRTPSSLFLQRNKPRSSASSTGTRTPSSLFLQRNKPRSNASPTGTRPPSSLFLQRNKPRSSASPTGTRPPSKQASLKCLPHWDSTT
ncbi:hypothetical protein Adt_31421 [Abeliophyllum distichum]|uniref:Uncharacterized protein n=1 Tax=Abeliophyllum distichum TaxID=126358 RepID=A0ABD1RE38_9LAMI